MLNERSLIAFWLLFQVSFFSHIEWPYGKSIVMIFIIKYQKRGASHIHVFGEGEGSEANYKMHETDRAQCSFEIAEGCKMNRKLNEIFRQLHIL